VAAVIFDDFNTNEGHFTSNVFNASGSDTNLANTSTLARITSDQIEGAGSQQLVLNQTTPSTVTRLRHLSGGGTPANNTAFTTSAGDDGWIGFYAKTTASGWTGQIYLEGASNNGSIERALIADGQWHLYEWNLDDTAGDANGWGTVSGIVAGVATVADGSHTIDSIVLRGSTSAPASSTITWDFLAKSDSGTIAALVPEPASLSLLVTGAIAVLSRRRRA
jgi:hypothetical protein